MNWPVFLFGAVTAVFLLTVAQSINRKQVTCFSRVFRREEEPVKYWLILALFLPLWGAAYVLVMDGRV